MAAYVAAVAGQRGKDAGALASAGAPKVSNKPIAAKGGVLTMDADPTGAPGLRLHQGHRRPPARSSS